jgi:hypothetical protein
MGKQFETVYNSEKGDLKISEYGRNIQALVDHACQLEDDNERAFFAKEIINLMNIMNPQNRGIADYREKLWNHLFRMSDYKLNVTPPEGITIHPPKEVLKNHDIDYPTSTYKNRHYGQYIQTMIKKALTIEDLEKRNAYSEIIASYMKLAYRTWNKEHFVSDDIIKNDLEEMSDNVLTFAEDFTIENLIKYNNKKKNKNKNNQNNQNNFRRGGNMSKGNNNYNQNRKRS